MFGWVYLALLVAAVAFVISRGRTHERLIVVGVLANSVITGLVHPRDAAGFRQLSVPLLTNEAWFLALTLFVAYRSKRFWPLLVASLELAAFLSLLAPLFGRNLVSYAMGVAQGLWAYLQLVILVLAVMRECNRGRWTSLPSS